MIVYKLHHIPTGLFYTPSSGLGTKTNLSIDGMVYTSNDIANKILTANGYFIAVTGKQIKDYEFCVDEMYKGHQQKYIKSSVNDWKIIKYTITELEEE